MHSQSGERVLKALWGAAATPTKGPRPRWQLRDIQAAAVALADADGLDGVTLTRVAASLGMTTTALYRYVDSKEDLHRLMLDGALGEPPVPGGSTWQDRCREWAAALRTRYAAHPWLLELRPTGMPLLPGQLGWIDAVVACVEGIHGLDALGLALLLEGVVRSYAALPTGEDAHTDPPPWLAAALAQRYPRLRVAATRNYADADSDFEQAIALVLRGATALADEGTA